MEIQSLNQNILRYLTYIRTQVELSNSINLTDINRHSEDFYCGLLNLIFGYNLVNINRDSPNASAIDLGDEASGLAIQVTSTQDLQKIKDTIKKFLKNQLDQRYPRLIIFNIRGKLNHKQDQLKESNGFRFSISSDLWDISDLLNTITHSPVQKLREILTYLQTNIKLSDAESISKEVATFIRLMEILSDESQPNIGNGYLEEPDPEGKIDHRFAEYSMFLKEEFIQLRIEYGAVLEDVETSSDLGYSKIRRLGLHLMEFSDRVLTQHKGDAKLALDSLVDHYSAILSGRNVEYDRSAVRFFILDQLIQCNVFPNREVEYAQTIS